MLYPYVKRSQAPMLIALAVMLIAFTALFASRRNYEFLLYVGIIVLILVLILFTNRRVEYPDDVLWGLTAWAFLHMAGGGLSLGGQRLYTIILIPLSETYSIFRYDQFVHIFGFGVATMVMHHLLVASLRQPVERWVSLSIVVVMAGLGVGALNEIVEFAATVLVPETGVGGYVNTSLDLVADLIGACLAMGFIRLRHRRSTRN